MSDVIADQAGSGGSGSWSVTKQGAGTLPLAAANTYSGGTTISAGTLQLGNGSALGTGGIPRQAAV